jgi:periplasmic divalent cation tolerance protein
MTDKIIVLVTCGSRREALKIGRALVEAKLAACANVLEAPVRSLYRWKGKTETAREFLMIVKASGRRFAAIERAVRNMHSYDVPEIIAMPIAKGSSKYLAWIAESVEEEK